MYAKNFVSDLYVISTVQNFDLWFQSTYFYEKNLSWCTTPV